MLICNTSRHYVFVAIEKLCKIALILNDDMILNKFAFYAILSFHILKIRRVC